MTSADRGDVSGGQAADSDTEIWAAVAASRAWLNHNNGDAEPELGLRILKIVEEAGEAAAAWIGTLGQNPPLTELDHVFSQLSDYTASRSLIWSCTSMTRNSETLHRCR